MLKIMKHLTILSGMLFLSTLQAVWQPPVVISNPSIPTAGTLDSTVIQVNPLGNAIGIWSDDSIPYFDPTESGITTAYYDRASNTWLPPQLISSLALNTANKPRYTAQGDPDIGMNSTGYAVAVWEGEFSEDNFPAAVFATTRSPSGVWDPNITILSDPSGDVSAHQASVSLNEAGTALAAWYQHEDDIFTLAVSLLPNGGAWTAPVLSFPHFDDGSEGKPYTYINPNGNAVVSWNGKLDLNLPNWFIGAATYDVGTNLWTFVTLDVGSPSNSLSKDTRCWMDANGNAVAIWQKNNFVRTSYFNGTSWESPTTLAPCATFILNNGPAVVMDLKGNITATWTSPDLKIMSASRPVGGTWGAPVVVSDPGTEGNFVIFQSSEVLAINPEGDVIQIWGGSSPTDALPSLFSNFKPFSLDWRPQEVVDTPVDEFDFGTMNIGLASCGFAVAMWQSENVVYASINDNLILPLDTTVTQCCSKFANGCKCVNVLTWSPDDCVFSYNIYCNDILIATVINTGAPLRFIDQNICRDCVYTISATNFFGAEGGVVPFVFL